MTTRKDVRSAAASNGWQAVKSSTLDSYAKGATIVATHWTSKGEFKFANRVGDIRERTQDVADILRWIEA